MENLAGVSAETGCSAVAFESEAIDPLLHPAKVIARPRGTKNPVMGTYDCS